MREILFLAHRIPYPPDKGDKIRSWHLLEGLSKRFRVHLGTFVDDPEDWQHVSTLQAICDEVCVRPLTPVAARLRSLTGIISGSALTLGHYRDRALAAWVRRVSSERALSAVFAYSSSMAPYAEFLALRAGGPRVVDFCDVDSDKWRQYAVSHRWPLSHVYAREARLLERAEQRFARNFDAVIVVAETEAQIVRRIAPGCDRAVHVLPNGVDTKYFDPALLFSSPFPEGREAIVFTGAMDYYPNIDGVCWFVNEILPLIHADVPNAHLYIVGSKPSEAVRSLARREGVTVTGRVPDVRPYLAHAAVAVAPLRIARGVQNKVLEALAMARPVVVTPNAIQGVEGVTDCELAIAADAREFARRVILQLVPAQPSDMPAARSFVADRYSWEGKVDALTRLLLQQDAHGPMAGAGLSPLLRGVLR